MSLHPVLQYADAQAALEFLQRAFGFTERQVHRDDDGTIVHAEKDAAGGVIMFSGSGPERWGDHRGQAWVYLGVGEVDALHDRAKAAGAEIVMGPTDQDYGSRDFSARDPEGNLWSFGTYAVE
jgi:uncharacterized glyoxalase superfamily protein PhnB